MIPGKRIEGSKLVPSRTELIRCIVCKPTNISADYLSTPELVVEVIRYGCAKKVPIRHIIARPMDSIPTGANRRTSGKDKRLDSLFLEILISLIDLEIAIEDMHIRLDEIVVMR